MGKLELLKSIDFGESVAELEADNLKNYFLETHYWQQIRAGDVDVVYGPKGSGKSAIYSLIDSHEAEFFQENIVLRFAENPRGATAFSDLQTDPPTSERSFIYLWKLYLLSLLGEHFESYGTVSDAGHEIVRALKDSGFLLETNPLRVFLGRASNYIRKYFNPESLEPNISFDEASGLVKGAGLKITFLEPSPDHAAAGVQSIDTLLFKANSELKNSGFTIWFMLDRLDVAFVESPELEENALRALFKTYLDLAGHENIKLRIFLRSDIWEAITRGGFREATHVQRATTISWDRAGLLNLIMLRFASNPAIRNEFNIDESLIKSSQDYQEDLFYQIFPDQVDTGRNPRTLDWLIGRVQDSLGYSAPRDLINLINAALRRQIHYFEVGAESPEGTLLFTRKALKEALSEASREKVEKYLFAEYPNLREQLEILKGKKTSQTAESLAELWSVSAEEARRIADRIEKAGVWKSEGSDPVKYWTMFIFRDGLEMVQGQAD
ncbi:MAG: hypothetical protein ABW094_09360 [Candidatus Thiodiazotropha sp.]